MCAAVIHGAARDDFARYNAAGVDAVSLFTAIAVCADICSGIRFDTTPLAVIIPRWVYVLSLTLRL